MGSSGELMVHPIKIIAGATVSTSAIGNNLTRVIAHILMHFRVVIPVGRGTSTGVFIAVVRHGIGCIRACCVGAACKPEHR